LCEVFLWFTKWLAKAKKIVKNNQAALTGQPRADRTGQPEQGNGYMTDKTGQHKHYTNDNAWKGQFGQESWDTTD
jgi:hypothetical protein